MLALSLLACSPETEAPATLAPADTAEAPPDLRAWVDAGAGTWVGTARETPIGDLPFAIEMKARDDGSLRGVAEDASGFSLTFLYREGEEGWTLTETGTMPGGFGQSLVLVPSAVDGDRVEWITEDDPDYLVVVAEHTGDRLTLEAIVRGERHALLDLARSDR